MALDKKRIARIIQDIGRYEKELHELDINERALSERKTYHAAAMVLFTLINRTLDLANRVIIDLDLGLPTSYHSLFDILLKAKIIDEKTKKSLAELIPERNLLAHEYQEFTSKDILRIHRKRKIIKEFAETIKRKLK